MIATVWLWFDMNAMSALERYTWSGWYHIALPGAYAVGGLALLGWVLTGAWRFAQKLTRR